MDSFNLTTVNREILFTSIDKKTNLECYFTSLAEPESFRMEVVHDRSNQEFKIDLDRSASDKAYLTYELKDGTIDFQHTYVPSKYRGQGIAEKLVQDALKFVDSESSIQKIIPSCSYVAKFLAKAPQYARYLAK